MGKILTVLGLGLIMSQVSWTAEIAERAENCSSIHFFLARGTGEAYPGKVADIANGACAQLGGTCDYEDIIYPAYTNDTTGFCMSIEAGVQNGTKQLTDYAERCPDSKLVLGGYSQGGQLVTDVLGGAGGFLWGDCEQSSSPELNYASVGSHGMPHFHNNPWLIITNANSAYSCCSLSIWRCTTHGEPAL